MGTLSLTRKRGEHINIKVGEETIDIYVSRIGSNRVHLAFEASKEVTILRSELLCKQSSSQERNLKLEAGAAQLSNLPTEITG